MSIKTEIDRIKQSKTEIISALKNKGVTVPSDASLDDLSALVEAIEVGTSEDLSIELTTQNNLITTQETTIDNIISALQGKTAGGGSDANIEICDVTLSINGNIGLNDFITNIMYVTLENGTITSKNIDVGNDVPITSGSAMDGNWIKSCVIQAVVGTNVYLYDGNFAAPVISSSNNVDIVPLDMYESLYSATITSGPSASIKAGS